MLFDRGFGFLRREKVIKRNEQRAKSRARFKDADEWICESLYFLKYFLGMAAPKHLPRTRPEVEDALVKRVSLQGGSTLLFPGFPVEPLAVAMACEVGSAFVARLISEN